jgi:hypothetical protein
MRGSLFQIVTSVGLTTSQEEKAELLLHLEKAPLVSIEATGVCIPTGNSEVLLAAVCKSPGHAWNDADIIELLVLYINHYW